MDVAALDEEHKAEKIALDDEGKLRFGIEEPSRVSCPLPFSARQGKKGSSDENEKRGKHATRTERNREATRRGERRKNREKSLACAPRVRFEASENQKGWCGVRGKEPERENRRCLQRKIRKERKNVLLLSWGRRQTKIFWGEARKRLGIGWFRSSKKDRWIR